MRSSSATTLLKLRWSKKATEVKAGCGAVGSVLRSGRRGRKFESSHPDTVNKWPCKSDIYEAIFLNSTKYLKRPYKDGN